MLLILVVLILTRLGPVTTIQEMTVAGIFDEGDSHYAEVFRQAVEDVNNNRYIVAVISSPFRAMANGSTV